VQDPGLQQPDDEGDDRRDEEEEEKPEGAADPGAAGTLSLLAGKPGIAVQQVSGRLAVVIGGLEKRCVRMLQFGFADALLFVLADGCCEALPEKLVAWDG